MASDRQMSKNDAWIERSSLFREWDEMKQEILKHKWYESEKVGHDIGWDRASMDWLIRHGKKHSSSKRGK